MLVSVMEASGVKIGVSVVLVVVLVARFARGFLGFLVFVTFCVASASDTSAWAGFLPLLPGFFVSMSLAASCNDLEIFARLL